MRRLTKYESGTRKFSGELSQPNRGGYIADNQCHNISYPGVFRRGVECFILHIVNKLAPTEYIDREREWVRFDRLSDLRLDDYMGSAERKNNY